MRCVCEAYNADSLSAVEPVSYTHLMILNINLRTWKSCMVLHTDILLPYSLRNGSMVMAKKIVFEIIADSD